MKLNILAVEQTQYLPVLSVETIVNEDNLTILLSFQIPFFYNLLKCLRRTNPLLLISVSYL